MGKKSAPAPPANRFDNSRKTPRELAKPSAAFPIQRRKHATKVPRDSNCWKKSADFIILVLVLDSAEKHDHLHERRKSVRIEVAGLCQNRQEGSAGQNYFFKW